MILPVKFKHPLIFSASTIMPEAETENFATQDAMWEYAPVD